MDKRIIIIEPDGVLILVLMEDTLGVELEGQDRKPGRLNPCFNGRYSRSINFSSCVMPHKS